MRIGYARVSKADGSQSLDLQREALRAEGIDDPANLYHMTSRPADATIGQDSTAGIVNLTHHKPRQPQNMASKPTPKYSIWGLGPSETS